MDYNYNFENADYLTTLDSIRSNLYKVTANINMEIFSLNNSIKENNNPELVSKKEKLEKCLASIIELTDSLANNFVEVDKLMGGKDIEDSKSIQDSEVDKVISERKKAIREINSEIVGEAIKNTNKATSEAMEEKNNDDLSEEVKNEQTEETSVEENTKEEETPVQEEVVEDNNTSDKENQKQVESTDAVVAPSNDEGPHTNAVEPPIEATVNDEVKEEVKDIPAEEKVEEEKPSISGESLYTANKTDDGVSRAILVTDDQYKKLEASRDSQIALCKFRDLLVGKEVKADDKNDLEALMEKANQLYQDGNLEEAEKIYNQISEMNKTN